MGPNDIGAFVRQAISQQNAMIQALKAQIDLLMKTRVAPDAWIDEIPGKRNAYWLTGSQSFTIDNNGQRSSPINMLVSQDGPFIATHYPIVAWKPNLPSTADNFGRWSPVLQGPLPTLNAGANGDLISISWELVDQGSNRNLQNGPIPPMLNTIGLGEPMKELPQRTYFAPNATLAFIPTYEDIQFATGPTTNTTGGLLVVAIPGFRALPA